MLDPGPAWLLHCDRCRAGERQLNSERPRFSGSMRSVDCWPLAKIFTRHLGASRGRYPLRVYMACDVTGERYPPLEGYMSQFQGCPSPGPNELSVADHPLGNSVGAIG